MLCSCMKLLSLFCGLLLLEISITQSRPTAPLVTLEAFCSSTRAGVKWTAISPSYRGQIQLDFSCTNSEGDVILRNYQDQCFHKTGGIPLLAHTRERSMTHVISRDLEPETICTFTAYVLDRWEEHLTTETTHCTIGGVASSQSILPAVCENKDGQCQCSCNSGFEGRAHNYIDGNICEAVPNTMVATESVKVTTPAVVTEEITTQIPIATTQNIQNDQTTTVNELTQDDPTTSTTLQVTTGSSTLGSQINPTTVAQCQVSTVTKTVTVTVISPTPI